MSFVFGMWVGSMVMGALNYVAALWLTRAPQVKTQGDEIRDLERMVGL